MIFDKALNLIRKFESFSPNIYICPAGYKTIGYGHLIRNGESYNNISLIEAEGILLNDVNKIYSFLLKNIKTHLNINQLNSIISFTFNVGCGAFQRSTLRQKINNNICDRIPYEFRRWVKANGKVLPGLIIRREAEIKLFLNIDKYIN